MVSPQIAKLLANLKQPGIPDSAANKDEYYVKVNELAKKAGMFYEKIRYLIDYKEEHTVRRNAIQRILKRNLFFKTEGKVAKILIEELIRGGYFENKDFLESRIHHIQSIIDKFLLLRSMLTDRTRGDLSVNGKIVSMTASELEIYLFGDKIEESVLLSFYETVKSKTKISQIAISEERKDTQIYIACLRSFLRADEQTIIYRLWLRLSPGWSDMKDASEILEIAKNFPAILSEIETEITNKLSRTIAGKLKNNSVYFSVIKEIVERYGADSEQIFANPASLEKEVKSILESRYKKENERIWKSALRAVIYILFTKTIVAFALELPYDMAMMGEVYYPALLINIIFHPVLLFLITYTIKPLGKKNTDLIISGMSAVVYDKDAPMIQIRGQKSKNFLHFIFMILYGLIFALSFGAVIYALIGLKFNFMSISLFIFFLTLVAYFGLRIRYVSKNWAINPDKERTLYFLGNILIMPIVDVGRWLSERFDSINLLVFVMDIVIETPFKLLLGVFDSFISFLKEKKEGMY